MLTRRQVLRGGAAGAASVLLPAAAWAHHKPGHTGGPPGSGGPGPQSRAVAAAWEVDVANNITWSLGFPPDGVVHPVPLATSLVDGDGAYSDVQPGDTLLLESGVRGALTIENIAGAAGQRVIVADDGGVVDIQGSGEYAGINVRNCQHLDIVGTSTQVGAPAWRDGLAQQANIKISGCLRGIALWAGGGEDVPLVPATEHVTVRYVEVVDTTQNPGIHTSNSLIGNIPLQRDIWVDRCYVHHTAGEGLYLGATSWSLTPPDTELDGVAVTDNLVTNTDWDGIQVSSAAYDTERENRVDGNVVLSCGHFSTVSPGVHTKGIVLNDGCVRTHVRGNWVDDAAEEGIYDQGAGGNVIGNNVVLRSGGTSSETGDGILLGNGHDVGGGTVVVHNTIVGSGEGFGIDNNRDVGSHEFRNNIVLGHATAIATNGNETVSNNRTTGTVADAGFVDEGSDDYHLASGSPCVDAGVDVSAHVAVDFDGVARPQGAGWDQGAFERA